MKSHTLDEQKYLTTSNNNHYQNEIAPEQIISSNNNIIRVYRQPRQISAQIFQLRSKRPFYNENNYPVRLGQPAEQGTEGYISSQCGMILQPYNPNHQGRTRDIDIQLKTLSPNFIVALVLLEVIF